MLGSDPRVRAIVEYAGVLGGAVLIGPDGETIARAGLAEEPGGSQAAVRIHELERGGYRLLVLIMRDDVSPLAVKTRLARCQELLDRLRPPAWTVGPRPGTGGGGHGNGPVHAELRVWPPGPGRWRKWN